MRAFFLPGYYLNRPNRSNATYGFFVFTCAICVFALSVSAADAARVPGAPRAVSAKPGNVQAIINFKAPASDGGSPITVYTVTSHPGRLTATGSQGPITMTGLTNGKSYRFTVTATNAIGTGPGSSSNTVIPATVPGAPTNVSATAGNARATVRFRAAASNGRRITRYTVTSDPGGITAGGPRGKITVKGLTNGTIYTFTVTATNSMGTGPASDPSNSVTPVGASHGTAFPLKLSSDGRHLVDQNNVPFLMVGDSPWVLMNELCSADVITYLNDRRARGYNTVIISLINTQASGVKHAPANCSGAQPFKTGDFSTPNDAYFNYAAWVINQAAARGMLVLLAPAYMGYGCGSDGWLQQMISSGTTTMQAYGAYLGNKFAGFPNIMWVEGCDENAASCGGWDVLNAMVAGIKSVDNVHLHTANCIPYSSAYDCYGGSGWLDVNSGYSDCTSSAGADYADYNQALMPLFYLEGFYENDSDPNHRASGQQCLDSQSYWAVLGGQIGALFGNYPIYMFAGGWKSALGSRGSINQAHFGAFFRSIPWYDLVPDYSHTVLVNGYGNLYDSSYVGCARTSDGRYIVAFLPTRSTVTIDMSQMSTSQATAQWFNPSTAAYTTIGTFSSAGTQDFTPPASGDWVLLLTGQ